MRSRRCAPPSGPGSAPPTSTRWRASVIYGAGATPSFLGYHGFPATICTSINDEIVHGIPSPKAMIREGDIVSIDCGAIVEGYHGDAAITVPVGEVSADKLELLRSPRSRSGTAWRRPGSAAG